MGTQVRSRSPRGAITLEFLLILPIIVILLWGTFQYTILFLVQQTLTHATTVAAREAGKHEPIEEVATVVDTILEQLHCIDIADEQGNPLPDSGVVIIQEVGSPIGSPEVFSFGDHAQSHEGLASPPVKADEVRVTLRMDLNRSPLCNFLFHFGIEELSWDDKHFEISALVKKQ